VQCPVYLPCSTTAHFFLLSGAQIFQNCDLYWSHNNRAQKCNLVAVVYDIESTKITSVR
jgi:hypothetical protein